MKVIREQELDSKKKYIFGYHPHGIIVLSRLATYAGNWEKLFPNIHARGSSYTTLRAGKSGIKLTISTVLSSTRSLHDVLCSVWS